MNKKTYKISGMHCASCEALLEKEIAILPGVANCEASHKKGTLQIESQKELSQEKIKSIIKKLGYSFSKNSSKPKNSLNDYLQIVAVFIAIAILVILADRINLLSFFPALDQNITVAMAFLVGLVASVSSCLAIVGGIVLSFSSLYDIKEKKHSFKNHALPHIYFHIGRVGGFAVLGGLLGLIGSQINFSFTASGIFTIIIGLVMFYLGLQILNLVPNITKLGFHLPKGISKRIDSLQKSKHPLIPAAVGALTFFLPCGFTQSMQLAAVGSQSFWLGSLIMAAFALGTLPVLISVGIGSSFSQDKNFGLAKKIVGALVILFAFYSLNSGLALAGHIPLTAYIKSQKQAEESEIKKDKDKEAVQVIKMDVNYTFTPKQFKIKKGVPVRWEITGINITGCSDEVIIPKLGITSGKLKKGLNVVEFTPQEEGILPFSCWMGMINGRFIVTDNNGDISDTDNSVGAEYVPPLPKGESCDGSCGSSSCGAASGGSCGCGR